LSHFFINASYSKSSSIKTLQKAVQKGEREEDKILTCNQAAALILSKKINCLIFSEIIKGNPDPDNVKNLFDALGVGSIFILVKDDFKKQWKSQTKNETHETFVYDQLNSILRERHNVAHAANVLNIARKDLKETVIFFKILTLLIDKQLYHYVKVLLI